MGLMAQWVDQSLWSQGNAAFGDDASAANDSQLIDVDPFETTKAITTKVDQIRDGEVDNADFPSTVLEAGERLRDIVGPRRRLAGI